MQGATEQDCDPFRAQLNQRWLDYMDTHNAPIDHEEWIARALSEYRDEIVHYGAQLLNDCTIRPWNRTTAQANYETYRREVDEFDLDPVRWELEFWERVRDAMPPELRQKLGDHL